MEYNQPVVGTAIFVINEGQFLIGKRKSELGDGKRCLPGGHLDFGESLEECGEREVYEEFGIFIKNIEFLGISNDITENKHFVTIFMKSKFKFKSGEPKITEYDEYYEWIWTDLNSLPENLFDVFKNFLNNNRELIKNILS